MHLHTFRETCIGNILLACWQGRECVHHFDASAKHCNWLHWLKTPTGLLETGSPEAPLLSSAAILFLTRLSVFSPDGLKDKAMVLSGLSTRPHFLHSSQPISQKGTELREEPYRTTHPKRERNAEPCCTSTNPFEPAKALRLEACSTSEVMQSPNDKVHWGLWPSMLNECSGPEPTSSMRYFLRE